MDSGSELYCFCRKPYKGNEFMIECDACNEWYHGKCVKVSEAESEALESYHCPSCVEEHGPSVLRMKKFQSRSSKESSASASTTDTAQRTLALISRLKRRAYSKDADAPILKLNSSELTVEYLAKHGFTQPILVSRKEGLDIRLPPSTTRLEEIENLVGGSSKMLDVIDVLQQENQKMSFGDFLRYWNSARGEKVYNVISFEVSDTALGEMVEAPRVVRDISWVDKFWPADDAQLTQSASSGSLTSSRSRETDPAVHATDSQCKSNVLGATKRELNELDVKARTKNDAEQAGRRLPDTPNVSDDEQEQRHALVLDEQNTEENEDGEPARLSIDEPKQSNTAQTKTVAASRDRPPANARRDDADTDEERPALVKPRAAKYCLMSAKGSFTDFHIDFGGSSVWYHVLRGEKIFYLIAPSEQSLRLYENWMWMAKEAHRDVFLCDQVRECHRLVVKQGQTVLLPTGWIHAVYTPTDSVVFGGNFLHSFNAALQIRVYELEKRLRTPAKFMFPNFQTVHWYVARAFLDLLSNRVNVREPVSAYLLEAARAVCDALKSWTATKQNYKLNRLYIPNTVDHQDVMTELERLASHAKRTVAHGASSSLAKRVRVEDTKTKTKSDESPAKHSVNKHDNDASLAVSDAESDASSNSASQRRKRAARKSEKQPSKGKSAKTDKNRMAARPRLGIIAKPELTVKSKSASTSHRDGEKRSALAGRSGEQRSDKPNSHGFGADSNPTKVAEKWKQPLKIRMKPRNRQLEPAAISVVKQLPELVVFDDAVDDPGESNRSAYLSGPFLPPQASVDPCFPASRAQELTQSAPIAADATYRPPPPTSMEPQRPPEIVPHNASPSQLPAISGIAAFRAAFESRAANASAKPPAAADAPHATQQPTVAQPVSVPAAMPITKLKIRLSTAVADATVEELRDREPPKPLDEHPAALRPPERTAPTTDKPSTTSRPHRDRDSGHKSELKMRIPIPIQTAPHLRLSDSSSDSDDQVEKWTSKLKDQRPAKPLARKRRRPLDRLVRPAFVHSSRSEPAERDAPNADETTTLGRRTRKANVRDDFVSGSEFEDSDSDYGARPMTSASARTPHNDADSDAEWQSENNDDGPRGSASGLSDDVPLENASDSEFQVSDVEDDEAAVSGQTKRKSKHSSPHVAQKRGPKRSSNAGTELDEQSKRRRLNEAIQNDHGFMARVPHPTVAENEQRILELKRSAKTTGQRTKPVTARQRIGKILGLSS